MMISLMNVYPSVKALGSGAQENRKLNNLAPLKKDVVSFSCSKKLEGEYMDFAPETRICNTVSHNANPAKAKLESILTEYIAPINEESNNNKPLFTYKTRIKSGISIKEKVVSKFGEIDKKEKEKFVYNAVDEILKYYTPQKSISKENIRATSKMYMEYSSQYKGVPPYMNEGEFLEYIVFYLKNDGLINFDQTCNISEVEAISEIKKSLLNKSSQKHCYENHASYIDTNSPEGIKHYAQDIVGARIILNDSKKETVQKILDGLRHAAKNGKLKITSVENYLPDTMKLPSGHNISDFEYIPVNRLKSFTSKTQSIYDKKTSKSGYFAIHINIDLSGNDMSVKGQKDKTKFDGYKGEIQIMDANIEQLKEVEDLCYKLKDNKNSFNAKKYKKFKEFFNDNYNQEKYEKEFNDYTYDLYLNQRQKFLNGQTESKFATIEELGYKGIIPPKLDFNNLLKIKKICDKEDVKNNLPDVMNENTKASSIEITEERNKSIKYYWDKCVSICRRILFF